MKYIKLFLNYFSYFFTFFSLTEIIQKSFRFEIFHFTSDWDKISFALISAGVGLIFYYKKNIRKKKNIESIINKT